MIMSSPDYAYGGEYTARERGRDMLVGNGHGGERGQLWKNPE